ncbi:MAG: valine--tRNA ligase [Pleurocapsa sp. SU_196_0]|nr:valine--tRNA ligase [Pleurocapsa sp. SU_196_0]
MNELPKSYEPQSVEPAWAERWFKQPFVANAASSKPAFTIVIPPPNVTGSLHLGHALDNSIIDILTRFKRLQGFEALYLPGMDHAGISTQVLVEKELATEGKSRHDLGREGFLERVWEFKAKNGGAILRQLQRLGVSADWTKERFTMDEGLSKAVRRAFVEYLHRGLIYRGSRITNWDPVAQTVVSDLEVDREERQGKMYTLSYKLEDGSGEMQVATVRPETIFADVAVAVHPDDERYKALVGQRVRIPLTDRFVPIIVDESVEAAFGTGCLKITPAHDPTDFEIGSRHNLEMPSVINKYAKLEGDLVPVAFQGLDRFEARKAVVKALEADGLLLEAKDYKVSLGLSERTKEPVEPLLMTQWWCNVKPMAQRVLGWLEDGSIQVVPERYTKVNKDWLENIRDWAIGRQLWWGHQVPVWYDADGKMYVPDVDNPDLDCDKDPRYSGIALTRDEDVLDTWFSAALWPFSTLGWPDATPELAKFYPNDVLVTGYDIIFFWVARMEMAGAAFTDQPPFKYVMLHGLYLDAKGQKMSKSKNNGIDPLDLMDRYGSDGCRFAWAYLSTGGQDIKHDERRYEMGRNFANKLWNASRFAFSNLELPEGKFSGPTLADRWIVSRLNTVIEEVTALLEALDIGAAIRAIYAFTWDDFCDWYIEASKPALRDGNPNSREILKYTLESILKLLHPFMPFVTSEIYAALNPTRDQLATETWPEPEADYSDPGALREFETVKAAITAVRALRNELMLPPAQTLTIAMSGSETQAIQNNLETFTTLAKAELGEVTGKTIAAVAPGLEIRLALEGLIEIAPYLERARKKVAEFEKQVKQAQGKLSNEGFVRNAPPEVLEEERRRVEDFGVQLERLRAVLAQFE